MVNASAVNADLKPSTVVANTWAAATTGATGDECHNLTSDATSSVAEADEILNFAYLQHAFATAF